MASIAAHCSSWNGQGKTAQFRTPSPTRRVECFHFRERSTPSMAPSPPSPALQASCLATLRPHRPSGSWLGGASARCSTKNSSDLAPTGADRPGGRCGWPDNRTPGSPRIGIGGFPSQLALAGVPLVRLIWSAEFLFELTSTGCSGGNLAQTVATRAAPGGLTTISSA